ncbi:MAG: zf-HC2 domain-containing protein [Acidobacteriota bacterium]
MEEHHDYKILLMKYLDNELSEEERENFQNHIKYCQECEKELNEFKKLKEVMKSMRYLEPQDEVWERYWTSIYNRLERGIGWILLSIGSIILLLYGAFKLIEDLIKDPTIALLVKIGAITFLAGAVILFVSALRERIFVWKRDKYREVKR